MKRLLARFIVAVFILLVLPLTCLAVRLYIVDWGASALKEDRGSAALTYIEPLAQLGDSQA
jgi:hypothetical protein